MRSQFLLKFNIACSLALAVNLTSALAQTVTWIGPQSGGEWNTAIDWDLGVPAGATNAFIGSGTNVNYNLPMAAASFGILTNNGVLNINTNGFNTAGIALAITNGGDKIFLNTGAVVTVAGNVTLSTNAAMTMTAGSSLTISGALDVSFGTSSKASGTSTFTNSGGALTVSSTVVNNNTGTGNGLLVIAGGTNNLGTTIVGRSSAGSGGFNTPLGSEGLIIYNGLVTMTNLNLGNSGMAASFLTTLIAGGTVTNVGSVFINQATASRASRLLQTGGMFVVPDPGVVNPNSSVASAISIYSVTGGTNVIGGFYFGASNSAVAATVRVTNSAVMYVGSQGIATNGAVTLNVSLNNSGLIGATAPWVGYAPMQLSGGIFTFQTADMAGNPNSIILSNSLSGPGGLNVTGGGTLTLDGTSTYAGNTTVSTGTLAVGGTGSLTSPAIYIGSGAIFDVSQVSGGFTLNAGQTLAGFGTVNGAMTVASSGTVYPGSNSVTGTLTLPGGLTETNGAVNEFQLAANPLGPGNDFLAASGGLVVSGINTVLINGTVHGGSVYPLISYAGGTFSGSIANFTVTGANGTLSNSPAVQTIYFIAQSSVRGPTNITWVGSIANNNWDTEATSNWFNGGTGSMDFFVPGDNVLFGNIAATNTVNIDGTVTPGSITVNSTTNYTLEGTGSIGGVGSLTVSNGTLTILTTNTFDAPVIFDGGTLSTPNIGASESPSGIGAASSDPGNLVFNGGTLAYTGGSSSTDHGMTLTNGGGTIDVASGDALTLNGNIAGNGTLTVVDTGTLILNNGNSYTNATSVLGAVLQLDNAGGAGSGTINFSNGTVVYDPSAGITVNNSFNFAAGTTNMIVVTSGSGANPINGGNWTGGGVIMVSNTFSPYTVNGNLDGVTGTILLVTPNAAEFRFNSGGGNSCFGSTNATFDLGNGNGVLLCRNSGLMNLGALQGGPDTAILGQGADSGTVIWSIGANNLSTTFSGTISNDLNNQISALVKVGTGTLTLNCGSAVTTNVTLLSDGFTFVTNIGFAGQFLAFTGDTTVSNGVLALNCPCALTNSPLITLAAPGAVLDASAMGYVSNLANPPTNGFTQELVTGGVFEVVSGQTLTGVGTIRGSVLADPGSTLNIGLPVGVLNVTTNASLSGTVNMNLNGTSSSELAAQSFTINSAVLNVTNIGGGLVNGTTFTLFNQGVFGLSVSLPLTDPTGLTNYVWADNLAAKGTITLTNGGVVALPPAPRISFSINGSTLSLSWPATGYTLQMETNSLSVGLTTNWVTVPGSSSVTSTNITVVPGNPTVFFRLIQ